MGDGGTERRQQIKVDLFFVVVNASVFYSFNRGLSGGTVAACVLIIACIQADISLCQGVAVGEGF